MSNQELGVWFVSVWLAFGASWAIAKRLNALIRMLATINSGIRPALDQLVQHTGYMRDASRDFEVRDRERAKAKALTLKGWQCPCCSYSFTVPDDSELAIVVFQWKHGKDNHWSVHVAAGAFTREIHAIGETGCNGARFNHNALAPDLPSYHVMLDQVCEALGLSGSPTWDDALRSIRLVMITNRSLMRESADRMQAAKDATR